MLRAAGPSLFAVCGEHLIPVWIVSVLICTPCGFSGRTHREYCIYHVSVSLERYLRFPVQTLYLHIAGFISLRPNHTHKMSHATFPTRNLAATCFRLGIVSTVHSPAPSMTTLKQQEEDAFIEVA